MEVSCQVHASVVLSPRKKGHWLIGWVDLSAGLDSVEKRNAILHAGNRTLIAWYCSHMLSHYRQRELYSVNTIRCKLGPTQARLMTKPTRHHYIQLRGQVLPRFSRAAKHSCNVDNPNLPNTRRLLKPQKLVCAQTDKNTGRQKGVITLHQYLLQKEHRVWNKSNTVTLLKRET